MDRYPSTSYPEVRFWCLQTLTDAFAPERSGAGANVLQTLSDEDASFLQRTLMSWVAEAVARADPPVPPFVKNKLAQTVALVARAQFPTRWPRFTHDFLDLLTGANQNQARSAADAFCRVMDAVDDEIVAGASGDARAAAAAARVKDAMRVDTEALRRLTEAWKALMAFPDTSVAVTATATARRYVDWMDVGLFVDGGFGQSPGDSVANAARANLVAEDADRRAAACEFFGALVAKGMDHRTKTELIRGLGLVETCARLNKQISASLVVGADPSEEDEDCALRAAQLAAAVGHELVSCLRAGDAAACADPSEPHAPPPPPETLRTAAGLLDALMPVAVTYLRAEDERAVAAALPLCSAYAHRLKDPFSGSAGGFKGGFKGGASGGGGGGSGTTTARDRDTGGLGFGDGGDGLDALASVSSSSSYGSFAAAPVCVDAATARSALRAVAEACVFRGAFPDERRAGVDFSHATDPRVREAETETAELRRDLFVVFRTVARVSPAIALGAVRDALAAALPGDGALSRGASWQQVEAAVAAVHLLGEGANDPAVKPGADGTADGAAKASPLGELFAFVVTRWNGERFLSASGPKTLSEATLRPDANPAATHRLVALAFLETCARYHLAVARHPETLLLPVLAAFLDARGARHADPEVAARACYLLSRFVKPLRQQIAAFLPEALAAMEEIVLNAVEPLPASPSVLGSASGGSVAVGKGTGGAMATAGNDDRLYAYEALGFLLGTEDVKLPEEAQVSLTEKACARLRQRLETAANAGDAGTCARCIVACANVAKGFSPRLATEIRPRIGQALVAGLAPATACLARFDAAAFGPAAGVLRQRVVAYFQRMVQGVGRLAFPYAAPLVDRVRASGGADDLKECFVLCNQLCATFKKDLAPFAETVTPALIAQTAAALAPFASPDGHAHGVLGVVSRVADVPDALARADASLAAREAAAAAAAAAAADAAARNTEESREARELEATFAAHLHALGASGLWVCFEGLNETSSSTRDTALATLSYWAAAHPSAISRKAALQALHKIAQAWFPDAATGAGERVAGFCQFASDVIVRECCVGAVLRGDLDVRDAAGAAAVGEAVAFQRLAVERLGPNFAAQLRDGVLTASLGLDPSLAAEYVAAVTSTAQTAHRDARAVVARCQKVVQGARPGMRRRPCKR